MEEFGWVLIIAVVWVLSSIGEYRKAHKKRREEGGVATRPERPRRRERGDREIQTGPVAGRRDLARDVDEAARRAEDALRRWEARQRGGAEAAPARVSAPARSPASPRPSPPVRSPSASDERREAYSAIAEMLAGRRPEVPVPVEARQPTEIPEASEAPDTQEWMDRPVHRPLSERALARGSMVGARTGLAPRPRGPVDRRSRDSALAALERLGPLQQAILWSEILGPPVSLRDQGLGDG